MKTTAARPGQYQASAASIPMNSGHARMRDRVSRFGRVEIAVHIVGDAGLAAGLERVAPLQGVGESHLVRQIQIGARQDEGRCLAGGEKPAVGVSLKSPEFGKAPVKVLVVDEKRVQHLRPDVGKGLGAHLFEALPYDAIIIGVAKKPLNVADRFVPILSGRSAKPLYVSAIGCSLEYAAQSIARMHGPFRIPTLLKIADETSRNASRQSSEYT